MVGLFNFNFETTLKVVTARRLKILQRICDRAMLAPTIARFGQNILEVLQDSQYEAPFAALYTCTATARDDKKASHSGSDSGSSSSSGAAIMNFRVNLMESLGIPNQSDGASHPMFPRTFHANMRIASSTSMGEHGPSSPTSSQLSELASDSNVSSEGNTPSGASSTTMHGEPTPESNYFDWSPYIAQGDR